MAKIVKINFLRTQEINRRLTTIADVEKLESSHVVGGNVNGTVTLENNLACL